MKNQRPQSAFSKQLGYGLAVSFAVVLCLWLFSQSASADTLEQSVRLAPVSGIDATASAPKKMAPGNVIVVGSSELRTPEYALFSWPNTAVDFNEKKYIEFSFDASSIPSTAVIDSVAIAHAYYIPGTMISAAKFEVWNGKSFVSFPSIVPKVAGKASQIGQSIDVTSASLDRAALDGIKVRFLSYGMGAAPMRTATDVVNLSVTYHLSKPTADDQALTMSAYSSSTITLTGTDPIGGGHMVYAIETAPLHGSLSAVTDGQVVYTPDGTSGMDSFTYTANNGVETSTPATVSLTITSPTLTSVGITATPSSVTVGDPITITVTGYDHFGNVLTGDSSTTAILAGEGATFSNGSVFTSGSTTFIATVDHAAAISFSATAAGIPSGTATVVVSPAVVVHESGASISAPVASPLPGQYVGTQTVALSASNASSIHYTADDSTPTCTTGTVYSGVLSISKTQTIKAVGCSATGTASAVSGFGYTISAVPAPEPDPVPTVPTPATVRVGGGGFSFGPALSVVGDVNGDGAIDMRDVSALVLNWGTSASKSDVNRDSKVNLLDFNALMVNWKLF